MYNLKHKTYETTNVFCGGGMPADRVLFGIGGASNEPRTDGGDADVLALRDECHHPYGNRYLDVLHPLGRMGYGRRDHHQRTSDEHGHWIRDGQHVADDVQLL